MRSLGTYFLSAVFLLSGNALAADAKPDAKPATPTHQVAPISAALPMSASQDQLLKYISDLATADMKGRLTGSPSGKKAEDYVEAAMRALKLDVRTQEVTFPLFEVQPKVALSLLDADGKPSRHFNYVDEFREVDYSGFGTIKGDLVFAGFGIVEPDKSPYTGLDMKGKIAVILSGAVQGTDPEKVRLDRKVNWAYESGARGVIVIPSGRMAQRIADTKLEAKMRATDWQYGFHPELFHTDMPVVFVHAPLVPILTGKTADELMKDPTSRVLDKKVELEVNGHVYPQAKSRNVFGIIPGTDPKLAGEVILIGAHYDHLGVGGDGRIFYGAADNASGTAVVLEAAKAFAACPEKPKRTIVFALWCGEEQGLFGSTYYTEHPLFPLEKTRLMIQIDSLAAQQGPCISNVTEDEVVQRFISKAAAENRVVVLDTKGQCASDDCPFLAKKVPACRFVGFGEHHHQDTDTLANLNPEMVKKTTDLIFEGLRNTAY